MSLSIVPVGPLQVLEGCYKVTPEPSLLQAEQPQLPQPVVVGEVLQPFDHLCGPPLDPMTKTCKDMYGLIEQIEKLSQISSSNVSEFCIC